MLPNSQDTPAPYFKGACDQPVPCHVGRQFLFPEWPVVHRQVGMFGTSMPETAINKNDDVLPAKREIRFSKVLLTPPPAGDAMSTEKFCKCEFRGLVAMSAYAGHDLGTLCLGENVRHLHIDRRWRQASIAAPFHPACGQTCGHKARTTARHSHTTHRPQAPRRRRVAMPLRQIAATRAASRCPGLQSRRDADRETDKRRNTMR